MTKRFFYKQCELVAGTTHTIGYIPEEVAKVGAKMTLDDESNLDDIEWTVTSVGDHRLPEATVRAAQRSNVFASIGGK
jgi:hypothetical protein